MESINTTNPEQQQSAATPTPEASGEPEKLFTQDDVNRIVSERLARAKRDTAADDRESALKAREARLDCREFLSEKQYPAELLDVLDTSDVEKFKGSVEKLSKLFQSTASKPANTIRVDFGAPLGGGRGCMSGSQEPIADAFKPKI